MPAIFFFLKKKLSVTEISFVGDFRKALIHVSTAYANCDKEEIAEMIYPPPADPQKLMECVDWMDEELLKSITKK